MAGLVLVLFSYSSRSLPAMPDEDSAKIFEISEKRKQQLQIEKALDSDYYESHSKILDILNEHAAKTSPDEAVRVAMGALVRYIVFFMSGGGIFSKKIDSFAREGIAHFIAQLIKDNTKELTLERQDKEEE